MHTHALAEDMANRVRASMLDDERYPIAVNPNEMPAHPLQATQLPLPQSPVSMLSRQPSHGASNSSSRWSESVVDSPVSAMSSNRLSAALTANKSLASSYTYPVPPTTYKEDPTMHKGEGVWEDPAFDPELLRTPEESFWRQWNIIKVLFFGFMAFVTGLVIAVVVINNKRQIATSSKATTAVTATTLLNTTTAPPSQISNTTSLTSSGLYLRDGVTYTMQLYYQPENTTDITYRMNLANSTWGRETFEKAQNMSLSIPPKAASPLSATASTDSAGVIYLDIFYVTAENGIAQASLACPVNSIDCKTTSNAVVSTTAAVVDTSLAAVNVGHARDWRIYYQSENHNIIELVGNSSGFGSAIIYTGTTLPGSSLTAVNVDRYQNNINVFFVDYDSKALFYTQYTDAWQPAKPVTTAAVSNWNPTAPLAVAYNPWPDQLRLYFVGSNSAVFEYTGLNTSSTSTQWLPQPGTNAKWARSLTPTTQITALAFREQVRWWQYNSNGPDGLVEGALNNLMWIQSRVL